MLLDFFGMRARGPLTFRVTSLVLVLEGTLVVATLIATIMGTQLPSSLVFLRLTPGVLIIVVLWLGGVWLLRTARTALPWQVKPSDDDDQENNESTGKKDSGEKKGASTARTIALFAGAALATLIGGVVLEESGNAIADHVGLNGVIFGATFLAAATALPEVSTRFAALKLGDYELAISDIFGGNAFLPVLFLLATLVSGKSVLPAAKKADLYLAGLGILLTTVYVYGLVFRSRRRVLRMGVDSLVVLLLYLLGLGGLIAVARG